MRLYILRHGDAPYDYDTGERVLSARGEQETQQIVSRYAAELADTSLIVFSPTRRARETLAVATRTLNYSGQLVFDACLRSSSSVGAVEAYFNCLEAENVMMVSHQPLVGSLLNYLTDSHSPGMMMGTSCLASLDLITFSRGCGQLNWLDTPEGC